MGRIIFFTLFIAVAFYIFKTIRDYRLSQIKKELTNIPSYNPDIEVLVGFTGDKESEQVAREITSLLIANGVPADITLIEPAIPRQIAEQSADSQVEIFVKGKTHEL
jgi:hypothetical protein